jgi:hypothetical protein
LEIVDCEHLSLEAIEPELHQLTPTPREEVIAI